MEQLRDDQAKEREAAAAKDVRAGAGPGPATNPTGPGPVIVNVAPGPNPNAVTTLPPPNDPGNPTLVAHAGKPSRRPKRITPSTRAGGSGPRSASWPPAAWPPRC